MKKTTDSLPFSAAPNATSVATFSFVENSKYIGRSLAGMDPMASAISGVGEPGYEVTTLTPDSTIALATAVLPMTSSSNASRPSSIRPMSFMRAPWDNGCKRSAVRAGAQPGFLYEWCIFEITN